MKRIVATMILIVLLVAFALPVYANSAPTDWAGIDSVGAVVLDKDCPIEVTKEVLTFDIAELPESYYDSAEDFLAYSANLTAEYTFYNPTDSEITATLVFPLGATPDYASIYDEKTDSYDVKYDLDKYDVTVDGAIVEKNIRYTLEDYEFDVDKSIAKLRDSYTSHGFYSPDMTVTRYTYVIEDFNDRKYSNATVAFDWDGGNGETRLFFPGYHGYYIQNNGNVRYSAWANNSKLITVYAIGQPFKAMPEWKFYENGSASNKDIIKSGSGGVRLLSTDIMTFEVFALNGWSEDSGVSRVDWYNAVVDSFDNSGELEYNFIDQYFEDFDYMEELMYWYEYKITIPPRSSAINTVSAPIYPAIDLSYNPGLYNYKYLLSPASKWADFKEIEININTPFYIIESNIGEFIKSESGYTYRQNGLPSGDLEFSLCENESPERSGGYFKSIIYVIVGIGAILVGGIIAVVGIAFLVGLIACIVILATRKKKQN